MEILPGVHRIESDLGVRFMCQYLLVGARGGAPSTLPTSGVPRNRGVVVVIL